MAGYLINYILLKDLSHSKKNNIYCELLCRLFHNNELKKCYKKCITKN